MQPGGSAARGAPHTPPRRCTLRTVPVPRPVCAPVPLIPWWWTRNCAGRVKRHPGYVYPLVTIPQEQPARHGCSQPCCAWCHSPAQQEGWTLPRVTPSQQDRPVLSLNLHPSPHRVREPLRPPGRLPSQKPSTRWEWCAKVRSLPTKHCNCLTLETQHLQDHGNKHFRCNRQKKKACIPHFRKQQHPNRPANQTLTPSSTVKFHSATSLIPQNKITFIPISQG